MGSRERKRAERRKRKRRAASSEELEVGGEQPPVGAPGGEDAEEDQTEDGRPLDLSAEAERLGVSKSELKNQRAREQLEPLEDDERPLAVSVGAVVSALIALVTVGAWVLGAEVDGDRPSVVQVFAPAILFAVMAGGMWRSRYWAVLGFQAILAILMVGSFITLVGATNIAQAVTGLVILIAAGVLFWFMIKALARIQMPEGPG